MPPPTFETRNSTQQKRQLDFGVQPLAKKFKTKSLLSPTIDITGSEAIVRESSEHEGATDEIPATLLKQFKKNNPKMNRHELERFVMAKIVEACVYKKNYASVKSQLDRQNNLIRTLQDKLGALTEQVKLLQTTVKRFDEKETEIPLKTIRSVGVQCASYNVSNTYDTHGSPEPHISDSQKTPKSEPTTSG